MAKSKSLGRVELQVLQYIDQHQPVTGRQVVDYWADKHSAARTTVMTTIDRLQDKGFLSRKKQNGVYHYVTKRSAASVLQGLVSDFVSGVLGGSLSPFAAYLNGAKGLNPDELAELKRIVEQLQPNTPSTPPNAQASPERSSIPTPPPPLPPTSAPPPTSPKPSDLEIELDCDSTILPPSPTNRASRRKKGAS